MKETEAKDSLTADTENLTESNELENPLKKKKKKSSQEEFPEKQNMSMEDFLVNPITKVPSKADANGWVFSDYTESETDNDDEDFEDSKEVLSDSNDSPKMAADLFTPANFKSAFAKITQAQSTTKATAKAKAKPKAVTKSTSTPKGFKRAAKSPAGSGLQKKTRGQSLLPKKK